MNLTNALTVIDKIIENIVEGQTKSEEKANTWTVGIGGLITALLSFIAYIAEGGTQLPDWTPLVVLVLGLLATVFGVSKTRNGFTKSQIEQLRRETAAIVAAQNAAIVEAGQVSGTAQWQEQPAQADEYVGEHRAPELPVHELRSTNA